MADKPSSPANKSGVLSLNIREKSALYTAYMPHIKSGGLFIPTAKPYRLGDDVFMLLSLMDDPQKMPVAGKVVWITPAGGQGGKVQGIGVQFAADEAGAQVKRKIENLLATQLQSAQPTNTM
jgi:type IV pilus assembly protein PilZ